MVCHVTGENLECNEMEDAAFRLRLLFFELDNCYAAPVTQGFLKVLSDNLSDALILRFLPRSALRTPRKHKFFAHFASFAVHILM